jgi:hypothetical protein
VKKFDNIFLKVEINTKDTDKVMKIAKKCPFMTIAFKLTVKNNLNIIVYGHNLKFLSNLLSYHFKDIKEVKSIK